MGLYASEIYNKITCVLINNNNNKLDKLDFVQINIRNIIENINNG